MQIERILRQNSRRPSAGVRVQLPSSSWPELIDDEPDPTTHNGPRRVCIVSSDLWGPIRIGRVGTHFRNLAFELADAGHDMTLLYTSPHRCDDGRLSDWANYYKEHNVQFVPLPDPEVRAGNSIASQQARISYAVLEWLKMREAFDIIHAPEIDGDLYHALWARRAGLALQDTMFVIGTHGGRWWSAEGNFRVFDEIGQTLRAQMELRCVELADVVVSPSRHMFHWLESHDVVLPERAFVWPNAMEAAKGRDEVESIQRRVGGLAYVGEFDPRSGIHLFLNTLRSLSRDRVRDLPIWFLGQRSTLFNFDAALQELHSEQPEISTTVRTDLTHQEAMSIVLEKELLVVEPALLDESPVVVSACISEGIPLIATDVGGVREMLHSSSHDGVLCRPTPPDLAGALVRVLERGATIPVAAKTSEVVNSIWSQWHAAQPTVDVPVSADQRSHDPSDGTADVTVCVVHHEQPSLLPRALEAFARQTVKPARIIVVDNGSVSERARDLLQELSAQGEIEGIELTVSQGENRYPGAARNRAARAATSEYLIFADDDNVPKPHMIETLVRACESDLETACFTCFADYFYERDEPGPSTVTHREVFLGGVGILGAMENAQGDTNSIVRRRAFEAVGGFHEVWGVGREDQDLLLRLTMEGYGVGVVPEALFYYRMTEAPISYHHVSREAGPSLAAMSAGAALDRDVRLIVEAARGLHDRMRILERRVRSLRTDADSQSAALKVVRGNLRSLEKRLRAERDRHRITGDRLEEEMSVRSDMRWLLRRLEGTPARLLLRRFAGYRTLLRRYL